jgi:hypothetical protein
MNNKKMSKKQNSRLIKVAIPNTGVSALATGQALAVQVVASVTHKKIFIYYIN